MFSRNIFSDRLKILRKAKRLKQSDLAAHLTITDDTISSIETGRRSPSVEVLVDLADFFGVSLDYLVGRSDDPERH